MFSWFRKRPIRPTCLPANPGNGRTISAAFNKSSRNWSEEVDVLHSLSSVSSQCGFNHKVEDGWITTEQEFTLLPQFVEAELLNDSGIHTVSTVQVAHPRLAPSGVFEYQHATGDNLREAFASGFEQFTVYDFPVFLDALREEPTDCTFLVMTFPKDTARDHELHRRAVLGPPIRCVKSAVTDCNVEEAHPFCHCCLLTNVSPAFKDLFPSRDTFGIRLYALREESGEVGADCRVNGEDWAVGVEALREYAKSWPGEGFEFRKQYVFLHTVDASVLSEEIDA